MGSYASRLATGYGLVDTASPDRRRHRCGCIPEPTHQAQFWRTRTQFQRRPYHDRPYLTGRASVVTSRITRAPATTGLRTDVPCRGFPREEAEFECLAGRSTP